MMAEGMEHRVSGVRLRAQGVREKQGVRRQE